MTPKEARERRITITLSKKQKAYLISFAEKRHLTPSKLVAYLLYIKTKDLQTTEELIEKPQQAIKHLNEKEITDKELDDAFAELEKTRKI